MSSYRFCRTDDIGLLCDALNRCWVPYSPREPFVTAAAFKRSIRDLQVWCSSCLVAFEGPDPVGVLIGAKRPSSTLVHRIAVHPDHCRRGHGRHMLTSLASKLAILGPKRIVAEVPQAFAGACRLFTAAGYVEETRLTDYALEQNSDAGLLPAEAGGFVVPVTVDDLAANDLLADSALHYCWERSVETLTARKGDIAGVAFASDERIDAFVLYVDQGPAAAEILSLRSLIDDGGVRLKRLLSRLSNQGIQSIRLPKLHPAEIPSEWLDALGFRSVGTHLRYETTARS
jgi:GNAT superfamily N-acetyltransferase